MPKLNRGRLSGLHGMRAHSSLELYSHANDLEAQIKDPANRDDPKWLQNLANKIRPLAQQKEEALRQKTCSLNRTARGLTRLDEKAESA
jgi:hypothetical protein